MSNNSSHIIDTVTNNNILSLNSDLSSLSGHNILAYQKSSNAQRRVYCKLHLGLAGQSAPAVFLLDSGADCCIIRYDLLRKLFPDPKLLHSKIRKVDSTVSGFGGSKVTILGLITFQVKFSENSTQRALPVHFFVFDTPHKNSTAAIIGMSSYSYMDLELTFHKIKGRKIPFVHRRTMDSLEKVQCFYLNNSDVHNVQQKVQIGAKQCQRVRLEVPKHQVCSQDDNFIVQQDGFVQGVTVVATGSAVETINGQNFVYGTVYNYSNKTFDDKITFHLENTYDAEVMPINEENMNKISNFQTLKEIIVLDENDPTPADLELTSEGNIKRISHKNLGVEELIFEPITEPNFAETITAPSFPEKDLKYDPSADNNGCVEGESLSDSKLKDKIRISTPDPKMNFEGKDTIQMGLQHPDVSKAEEMGGFEMPDPKDKNITAKDAINLEDYDPEIRGHIKDIFIDSFPEVVSLHQFDIGNLSHLLGYYTLKLKKGARLPRHSKLYYLSPADSQQMKDILQFMEKSDIITKCPQGGDPVKMCCSAYLIPRKDGQSIPRLIINYIPLNRLTEFEPPIIPTTIDILNKLRDSTYFSSIDLTGAFNSIKLHPSCRNLTNFITVHGAYFSNRLLTGGISSPGVLHRFVDRVINYVPKRDSKGNIIWDDDEVAKLTWDPILGCHVYFDDIIIYSPFMGTHEKSREHHFKIVKKVIERLSVYKGKISLKKSTFFVSKINFLGWNISNNYITPDPKRIDKVLSYPIPSTAKTWRGFVGIVNSLRVCLGFSVLKNISILSELTSDKANHSNPTTAQLNAFHDIKKKLATGPIFASLIDSSAPKIVYSDAAAAANMSVGSVLCQLSTPKKGQTYLPKYLYMSDKTHRLILEHDLRCVPVRHIKTDEDRKTFLKSVGPTFPPETNYLTDKALGLGDNLENSLALTLKTLFSLHSMSNEDPYLLAVGQKCAKFMSREIIGNQVQTFHFNNDKDQFKTYIENLKNFKFEVDSDFCIIDCLSDVLSRPMVVVSSLEEHAKDPIFRYRTDLSRPPFFILAYKIQDKIVTKSAYIDKEQAFDVSSMRGSFEIVSYYSHTLPSSMRSTHIMEIEALGIILSLEAFAKLIGSSECLLVCDSKALFYLFNHEVQLSSEKVTRWGNKIFSQFPQLKVTFCKSAENLADIFTRVFNAKPPQMKMTSVERLATCIDDKLMEDVNLKTFTLSEWQKFVDENPGYLLKSFYKTEKKKQSAPADKPGNCEKIPVAPPLSVDKLDSATRKLPPITINELTNESEWSKVISGYVNISESVDKIKDRFSHEKIIEQQKIEFQELYENALTSPKFEFGKNDITYFIQNGLLFRKIDDLPQILLPNVFLNVAVAYAHVSSAHGGRERMGLILKAYHARGLKKKIDDMAKTCIACLLNNYSTSVQKFGHYPVIHSPFYSIHIDFISDLTLCEGFRHLLIIVDSFTLVSFCIAFETETSKEFLQKFVYGVVQIFRPAVLHCDNSLTFLAGETLKTLASLKVKVVHTVPNHAYSFGQQESYIKIYKTAMRKYMSTSKKENWLFIPVLISNFLNSQISPRHKTKPFELLFGQSRLSESYEDYLRGETVLHPLITKEETEVKKKSKEWDKNLKEIEKIMNEERKTLNDTLNKHRKSKEFFPGQIVFQKRVNPKSFETLYIKSVYMVVQERVSTCLIARISDGYLVLAHKNLLKAYKPDIDMFNTLPKRIKDLCVKLEGEPKLSKKAYHAFLDFDSYEIPDSVISYMTAKNSQEILEKEFGYDDNNINNPKPGTSKKK